MVIPILLICLGFIALCLFLFEKIRKYSAKEVIIKSIASTLFIALAVYCDFRSEHHLFGTYVIVALVFGLLGDIWLDLKFAFPEQEKTFTYAGFFAFGIGHILYITGMMICFHGDGWWWNLLIAIGFGLLGGLVVILLERPLKLHYGNYKWIVGLYSFILLTMLATTFMTSLTQLFQSASFNMLFAGGILFVISDLILSGTYFGIGKTRAVDIITNSMTYYAAQYLIAFSLFFL